MLVVCQTCCEEKRFLAAASLPVALSATSYLLFLSRAEQHSALLASEVFIFLFLSCWQRMTKVDKTLKDAETGTERRNDGWSWKAVSVHCIYLL